jgi:hypothetical protein
MTSYSAQQSSFHTLASNRETSLPFSDPELDPVRVLPLAEVRPALENDKIYSAITSDDPEVIELARSIQARGVQDPLLVSRDGYIISGHCRRFAAQLVGLKEVPVRIHPISRITNQEEFLKLLVEMNSQRIKSTSVQPVGRFGGRYIFDKRQVEYLARQRERERNRP